MVGKEVARIDWSIEPRNTGSIMLTTMSRLSLCVSGSAVAGLTPGSLTLASMNVQSAATTAAQRLPAERLCRREYRQTLPLSFAAWRMADLPDAKPVDARA